MAAHEHAHTHAPTNFNLGIAIGTIPNLLFVVIEAGYGALSHWLALIADPGHNFSDVMTPILAWWAMALAMRSATAKHTFGFKKGTILVSLGSALFLCVTIRIIICEAVGRRRKNVCY